MPPKFLGVCLCFTSFLAFHGNAIAATDHPRSLLKGISIIKYYDYVESTVGGERCKINYQNLTTSLQFVANQSAKLKIITEREHATRRDELYSQVRSLPGTNTDKILAANKSADDYNFMPTLVIHVSPLELSSGCAGVIDATLSAHVDATRMIPTRTVVLFPTIEIWSKSISFVAPQQTFSERAISIGEQLLKQLVNDWTASQE